LRWQAQACRVLTDMLLEANLRGQSMIPPRPSISTRDMRDLLDESETILKNEGLYELFCQSRQPMLDWLNRPESLN